MSKVESGQIVIFSEPIQFLNGHSVARLQFIKRSQFLDPLTGIGYHIVNWRNGYYKYTIEGEVE